MKKSMENYKFTAGKEISEFKLNVCFNRSKSLRHNFVSKISSEVKGPFTPRWREMLRLFTPLPLAGTQGLIKEEGLKNLDRR